MVQHPPAAMTALSELAEREDQQRLDPTALKEKMGHFVARCPG
jgi:hypothetical protein